jgi:spermidine synthase
VFAFAFLIFSESLFVAKKKSPELLTFSSPWVFDEGVVRIAKPADDVAESELLARVYRSEAKHPYILENRWERRLHFNRVATQSVMHLHNPTELVNVYTRKMMSFLLFNPKPKHILMIGLGGGSLAKFCYLHFPKTRITVVEIDAEVIALREEFHIPNDNDRFSVVHEDGAHFVENFHDEVDVILVDAFDADGIAPSLATSKFFLRAAQLLSNKGVLVMNFLGQGRRYVENIHAIRAAFPENVVLVPISSAENVLLFALRQRPPQAITDELESLARRLESRLRLDFPQYLRRICQGHLLDRSPAINK